MVSHRQGHGYIPDAGHIVKVDLDPSLGDEQGGWRPALVLSPPSYNGKTGLAVLVPITDQVKGYPFEVPLPSRVKTTGVILADAIRNLDWRTRKCTVCRDGTNRGTWSGAHMIDRIVGVLRALRATWAVRTAEARGRTPKGSAA